ncbi:demethylmenaquinone methyltransferase [Fusarium albosuccineum]|uniref:Demethylmenaquinone methyltransferase n=1 Tax=Fusarium albosuccineum TaxID=1237068 RepID=A0A8H4L9Y8_9HYPO|nr:demethylmenaquinone methyltransferase [Fusarium albosuccineum]
MTNQQQEKQENAADDDSAYGVSVGSASYQTSLASSVINYKCVMDQETDLFRNLSNQHLLCGYRYENGRRYHAFRAGTYLLPNDDTEQDGMDLVHHLYRLLLGGQLFLAPIANEPKRVLDLGTGTGIWAMDFADEYPSAEVIGTDLSPIQPKWTPPNCVFEVDDFEAEWLSKTPFDFIHGRELEGCIGDEDQLFRRAYENLTPGGYIEFQATYPRLLSDDGTAEKAENAQKWLKHLLEGSAKFGKSLEGAINWKDKLEKAGFVDVQQEIRKLPIGGWPKDAKLKEIGKLQGIQQIQAVESYTPRIFSTVLGWKEEEVQVYVSQVRKDLKNPAIHLYAPIYFVWGKKPSESE